MIIANAPEQKNAKLKFFGVYFLSVLLIVAVLAAVWRAPAEPEVIMVTATPVESKTVQVDVLLHNKFSALDNLYSMMLSSSNKDRSLQEVAAAESGLKATLDSLENVNSSAGNEQEKAAMTSLVANFRRSLQSRSSLLNNYTTLLKDTAKVIVQPVADNQNAAALQELKNILVQKEESLSNLEKQRQSQLQEKDKAIASLQQRLAQKPTVVTQTVPQPSTGGGEWQQKYAKIKSSYDKLAAENVTLNKSYRTLVDDNRRLLSQIQRKQ